MYNEGTLSHPFQCNFRLMQNAACAVLFKYMHYGSNRHDEWLLICPQGKLLFARKTKRGHRAYGSCGAWHVDGDNLMLTGWACREGAKKHDLTFKKNHNKLGEWTSTMENVTRHLKMMGWCPFVDDLWCATRRSCFARVGGFNRASGRGIFQLVQSTDFPIILASFQKFPIKSITL